MDTLVEWAVGGPATPSHLALLGDVGIGKTTTCRMLTRNLQESRQADSSTPFPVYLDLRELGATVRDSNPRVEDILDDLLRPGVPGGPSATGRDLIDRLGTGNVLVIIDGLDEVLVYLPDGAAQQFTRRLWDVLRIMPTGKSARPNKLLMSCRTHYFRSVREQATHFTGEDRSDRQRAADYLALVLLPFTDEQIARYLELNLPEVDLERFRDLIGSVHNLTELAQRPFTLGLIVDNLSEIERAKLDNRRFNGVTLYRSMVRSWLERDIGKHRLEPDHKILLMEHLAATIWGSGRSRWHIGDVEQWFVTFLDGRPDLNAHYRHFTSDARASLKNDPRTATFLTRFGRTKFSFAHTSLREFFLAGYLPVTWPGLSPT